MSDRLDPTQQHFMYSQDTVIRHEKLLAFEAKEGDKEQKVKINRSASTLVDNV